MTLRTPLSQVKGLGSAKEGVNHWWRQRLSAIAIVPLCVWFIINIVQAAGSEEHLLLFLASPLNSLAMMLFIGSMIYHGYLGMQVIIEDYVHCATWKMILLIALNFVCVVSAVAGVAAMLALHISLLM